MNHLEELAHQIAARGVDCAFGIPGSGPSLVLLDRLEKAGIPFHLTHFEGSAALMAGAAGRLSGRCGLCVSIKGPGLTNMLPGLAACALESFPVVSISEAYLPGTPPQKSHKRLDHARLLSAVVKRHDALGPGAPRYEELARQAEAEAPGVVHLDIAEAPFPPAPGPPPAPAAAIEPGDPRRARQLLAACRRPVVIAGTLACRQGWAERLNALCLPVFSTAAAKGVVDEELAHAAGVFTGVGGPLAPERAILPAADMVVALGLRHNEVLDVRPFTVPALHVDPLGDAKSFGFKFDCRLEGAPHELEEVFGLLAERGWGLEQVRESRRRLEEKLYDGGFLPAHVFRGTAEHFRRRARVVLDTGNFCTIGEHAWSVPHPRLYLASGQGRYMGIGLPLGIGAALHDPDLPTVVFTGDGGIGMFAAEMRLASQNRLPLLLVLMSDAHLGTIRAGALNKGLTQVPTRIAQPSWLKAMEGMGVPGERVASEAGLVETLSRWKADGPLYVETLFDADAYQSMTEGVR